MQRGRKQPACAETHVASLKAVARPLEIPRPQTRQLEWCATIPGIQGARRAPLTLSPAITHTAMRSAPPERAALSHLAPARAAHPAHPQCAALCGTPAHTVAMLVPSRAHETSAHSCAAAALAPSTSHVLLPRLTPKLHNGRLGLKTLARVERRRNARCVEQTPLHTSIQLG